MYSLVPHLTFPTILQHDSTRIDEPFMSSSRQPNSITPLGAQEGTEISPTSTPFLRTPLPSLFSPSPPLLLSPSPPPSWHIDTHSIIPSCFVSHFLMKTRATHVVQEPRCEVAGSCATQLKWSEKVRSKGRRVSLLLLRRSAFL